LKKARDSSVICGGMHGGCCGARLRGCSKSQQEIEKITGLRKAYPRNINRDSSKKERQRAGERLLTKRSELHEFKVMPKRWVMERSFAWLEKNRRLWKNCERKLNTNLQFICLAFLSL